WDSHPEILGVHVQLLAVQLRELGEGRLNVVQVLDGFPKGGEHFPAMGADLGVADDGGGAGEVPKVIEEPLGPGVDDQQPGESTAFLHVDLAPDAGDELLLLGCPVHHGGGWRLCSASQEDTDPVTQCCWTGSKHQTASPLSSHFCLHPHP
uniref:Uncharacterized protein n=1 Tax=Bubo bubo TaxID=30461 RepID=A0A8C0F7H4_BUBBB